MLREVRFDESAKTINFGKTWLSVGSRVKSLEMQTSHHGFFRMGDKIGDMRDGMICMMYIEHRLTIIS